jgi:hypothetical protein
MGKSDVYVANTSFVASFPDGGVDEKGNPTFYNLAAKTGQKFRGGHQLVKLAPNYFDSDDGSSPVIEAATAAPGELRGA